MLQEEGLEGLNTRQNPPTQDSKAMAAISAMRCNATAEGRAMKAITPKGILLL